MELRLPDEKLQRLLEMVTEWDKNQKKKKEQKKNKKKKKNNNMIVLGRELVSLLHYACKVIPLGRTS